MGVGAHTDVNQKRKYISGPFIDCLITGMLVPE